MKKFILAAILVFAAIAAQAQFHIGPRFGVDVNSLHFNSKVLHSDNRVGFTGGVQAEFMIPALGFGFDASVMYVKRSAKIEDNGEVESVNSDYIEIPINLKYKFGIPVIGSFVKPYVFTGPSFSFLTSRRFFSDLVHKKNDAAWNFGFGLEFVKHLQIGASYGIGMTKALRAVGIQDDKAGIEGKNRYWTLTAAWLF